MPYAEELPLPSGRLRVNLCEAVYGLEQVGEPYYEAATAQSLADDALVGKWVYFNDNIGRLIGRRDLVQVYNEPRSFFSRLGLTREGDDGEFIDVVVDQEYFMLVDFNTLDGVWLSTEKFDIRAAIAAYAASYPVWAEHFAVREHMKRQREELAKPQAQPSSEASQVWVIGK